MGAALMIVSQAAPGCQRLVMSGAFWAAVESLLLTNRCICEGTPEKNCFQKNLFILTFISFMHLMCLELCGTSCFKGNEDLVTRHTCHQASV